MPREPFEAYCADPALNWSKVKNIGVSPAAYRWYCDNERPDTMALKAGRYVHAAVFEPHTLTRHFAIYDGDGTRASKDYKAFAAEQGDKVIFKLSEVEPLDAVADAVRASPAVRPYLDAADATFEESMRWVDPLTEMACKGRMDWNIPSMGVILDLKTAADLDLRKVCGTIARLDYHAQLEFYAQGCAHALGWVPEHVVIVGVEKKPPYDVGVFILGRELRDIAAERVRTLMALVKDCTDRNEWPGRYPEPVRIERETPGVPTWIFGADDDEGIIYEEQPNE